ncbi:MAG: hypothetical protein ACOC5K_05170 [Chloroflexota bacterium]
MARISQEEFLDRVTLYPEAPETSSEPPFQEQADDLESEHIHPADGENP